MLKETPEILSVRIREGFDVSRVEFALDHYRHLASLNDYVKIHWHYPFQLTDAAAAVGISPSRLSHLFLEKTGITFSEWVRYERVKRAKIILASNDKSISEVGYSVGYRNSRTFVRSFSKTTGISPAKYRKILETQLVSEI